MTESPLAAPHLVEFFKRPAATPNTAILEEGIRFASGPVVQARAFQQQTSMKVAAYA